MMRGSDIEINESSGIFFRVSIDPNYIDIWDIVWKNRQTEVKTLPPRLQSVWVKTFVPEVSLVCFCLFKMKNLWQY